VAADDACVGYVLVVMGFALLEPAGAVHFPFAACDHSFVDCA
jgi:hypothetical protein